MSCLTLSNPKRLEFGNTKLISPIIACIPGAGALEYEYANTGDPKTAVPSR